MANVKGFEEIQKNLNKFKKEAKGVLTNAVFHGGTLIQNEAKSNHPYKDRTGNLTGSIQAGTPKVRGTKIIEEVTAGMEYAVHVEMKGYPFMFPALEKMSHPINIGIVKLLKAIRWVD